MQVMETYIFMHVQMISGEHGIGYGKMDYLAAFAGETSMRLMKGIKEVFDPKMILNPGKICYKL